MGPEKLGYQPGDEKSIRAFCRAVCPIELDRAYWISLSAGMLMEEILIAFTLHPGDDLAIANRLAQRVEAGMIEFDTGHPQSFTYKSEEGATVHMVQPIIYQGGEADQRAWWTKPLLRDWHVQTSTRDGQPCRLVGDILTDHISAGFYEIHQVASPRLLFMPSREGVARAFTYHMDEITSITQSVLQDAATAREKTL
jgi:hypothetical protein